MDNELLLYDRLETIKTTVKKYGEENFYLSFSGGKDSTVLHHLVDMAIPDNKIPRVFANTGIEYKKIVEFVEKLANDDNRIIILQPSIPIKQMLELYGFPFKSKMHSKWVDYYQRKGMYPPIKNYLGEGDKKLYRSCPKILKYQFTPNFDIRISDKCCLKMKEEPLSRWAKENGKNIYMNGIMKEEGGRRVKAQCLKFADKKLLSFQPMIVLSKEWEDWFIKTYNIKLCELYYPPYNFNRTGCKGCPFAIKLNEELKILEKFFPTERKQCEIIWEPIYNEYRRIGYRLKED